MTDPIWKDLTTLPDLPPMFHLFKYSSDFDGADYVAEKEYPFLIETFNATDTELSPELTT